MSPPRVLAQHILWGARVCGMSYTVCVYVCMFMFWIRVMW